MNVLNRQFITVMSFSLLALALADPSPARADDACAPADNTSWVKGGANCLAIKTHLPAAGGAEALVITLHGDLSSGGSGDYMIKIANRAAEMGAIGVGMMRPGYSGDERTSSGTATRDKDRDDWYSAATIDSIGLAVATLKAHHKAKRVIMLGHSGGAVISGVLAGRAAPLVDALLLVSCPCNVPIWRENRGRKPLGGALSPHDYIAGIPKQARIVALTGADDSNTGTYLARDYVASAKAAGLNATFIEIPDAGHGFGRIGKQPQVFDALAAAINGH